MKRFLKLVFIFIFMFFLLSGLIKTVFFPDEINVYENRKANKLEKFSFSSYLDSSFQDSMENSLSDQVPFSSYMKKTYNVLSSGFIRNALSVFPKHEKLTYTRLGDIFLINDRLVYGTSDVEYLAPYLKQRCENYNQLFSSYENLDFYVYYIEKDTDMNFETGEKSKVFEFFSENLSLPQEKIARFEIKDFSDFCKYFYSTDHHWNLYGSYEGYKQLLPFLNIEDEALKPIQEVELSLSLSGSKAQSSQTSDFKESFSGYRFDFPKTDIYANGYKAQDYGAQDFYLDGNGENITYALFYGDDLGEIVFDTKNPEKENILIIGESFDNAILKLLATHFNKTVSVDLRYYSAYMGKEFDFSQCVEKYNIDKVLLIGNVDFFVSSDFEVKSLQ